MTSGNGQIILVIEDEQSLADLLRDELTTKGFKVVTAANGVEGLQRLQDVDPDLIICDRAMPAMTGGELLERIRGIFPQYRDLPFIFLTALTDPQDKEKVSGLMPTAYLEKPLDFDLLLKTIEEALPSTGTD